MKNIFRIIFFVLYLSGIFILFVLSGDKYSFMYEMDNSVPAGAIKNNSQNGVIVSAVILLLLLIIQMIYFIRETNKYIKMTSLLLASMAVFIFLMRL